MILIERKKDYHKNKGITVRLGEEDIETLKELQKELETASLPSTIRSMIKQYDYVYGIHMDMKSDIDDIKDRLETLKKDFSSHKKVIETEKQKNGELHNKVKKLNDIIEYIYDKKMKEYDDTLYKLSNDIDSILIEIAKAKKSNPQNQYQEKRHAHRK